MVTSLPISTETLKAPTLHPTRMPQCSLTTRPCLDIFVVVKIQILEHEPLYCQVEPVQKMGVKDMGQVFLHNLAM